MLNLCEVTERLFITIFFSIPFLRNLLMRQRGIATLIVITSLLLIFIKTINSKMVMPTKEHQTQLNQERLNAAC
jgi:hypothetical protein